MPVLTLSPKVTLPRLVALLITPLKVELLPALTAILLVTPLANLIALLKVLPLLSINKAPPLIVTRLEGRLVALLPPVAIESTPPLIVVAPV